MPQGRWQQACDTVAVITVHLHPGAQIHQGLVPMLLNIPFESWILFWKVINASTLSLATADATYVTINATRMATVGVCDAVVVVAVDLKPGAEWYTGFGSHVLSNSFRSWIPLKKAINASTYSLEIGNVSNIINNATLMVMKYVWHVVVVAIDPHPGAWIH
jgi:hypothetical protein